MTTTYTYILMAVLAILFFLTLPMLPYMSRLDWGYYPGVAILLALVVLAIATFRGTPRQRLP